MIPFDRFLGIDWSGHDFLPHDGGLDYSLPNNWLGNDSLGDDWLLDDLSGHHWLGDDLLGLGDDWLGVKDLGGKVFSLNPFHLLSDFSNLLSDSSS